MKTLVRLFLTVVLAAGLTTGLFANGLNLNGTGAKSDAMGGAFVGLANDFSAAYWNPAGLAQIAKASFSLYGADIIPAGTWAFAPYGIDACSTPAHYLIPGLGFFTPLGKKFVVGVYVYAPSGAGAEWDGADLANLTEGQAFIWKSKLGIFTISPSVAYKISDKILLGGTVDINYGMLKMDQPFDLGQYSEDLKGWAVGGTLGLLVKPVKQFSFGVSYKFPFTAKLKGDVTIPMAPLVLGAHPVYPVTTDTDTGTRQATWPMWLAGGIAIKPTDKLTITADVQYTNWKKLQTIPVSFENANWEYWFGADGPFDRVDELVWKDTFQYRFGAEYWVSNSFALRAGYYLDQNPGPVETQNILLPEFKYNWFTAGFGYQSGKLVIDAAIQYGKGGDISVPLDPANAMPGVHGMSMWVPSLNFTYKF
jgi:long-chain fatty acid transport protein